jgi:hypothetical protein
MGELVGTSLFDLENKECGKCGMKKHTEESKNCCKDISVVVKTGDSHTFFQSVYDLTVFSIATPEKYSSIYEIPSKQESNNILYGSHSPPLLEYPLFIQHHNFRI